jgi:class 3 adenylate cyclase
VLDAVEIDRAAVVGLGPGSPIAIVFAATHPERTSALVLVNGSHFRLDGMAPEARESVIEMASSGWGSAEFGRLVVPSATDAERELLARHHRQLASPGRVRTMMRMLMETDVRDALPLIQVPTLVIGRTGSLLPRDHAQYLAEHIADSKLVELAGEDYLPAFGDADSILDEIRAFVTGRRAAPAGDRVLATVLFTDIVQSTRRAAELGDRRWRELLASHHAAVRRRLEEFRGREVDTAGDGFLATFDGPGRAIRCVEAIQDSVRALGLEIRAGLHTGEIEAAANGVTGIAVHIGARVAALAGPSEVLVTSTVKDLVVGSEIAFEDRGQRTLKGVPGEWRIYAVSV